MIKLTRGHRSSEFHITVLSLVVAGYLANEGHDAAVIAAVLSPVLTYIGGRSYKKGHQGET